MGNGIYRKKRHFNEFLFGHGEFEMTVQKSRWQLEMSLKTHGEVRFGDKDLSVTRV